MAPLMSAVVAIFVSIGAWLMLVAPDAPRIAQFGAQASSPAVTRPDPDTLRGEPANSSETVRPQSRDGAQGRVADARPRLAISGPPVVLPALDTPPPTHAGDASRLPRPVSDRPGSDRPIFERPGPTAETPLSQRARLASAIQSELKRVGCYAGEIDGEWGAATRQAMRAFNSRVNATLPVEQPDYILLTLLQGHAATACGTSCPVGQVPTGDGACQPRSVVAGKKERSVVAPAPQANTASPVTDTSAKAADEARREAEARLEAARLRREADARMASERAEAERARLTTEARKRAAEVEAKAAAARAEAEARATARAESERLARLAAAETARQKAAAATPRPAAAPDKAPVTKGDAPPSSAALAALAAAVGRPTSSNDRVVAPSAVIPLAAGRQPGQAAEPQATVPRQPPNEPVQRPAAAAPMATLPPSSPTRAAGVILPRQKPASVKTARRVPRGAEPRYVGRFVPPPTYRVGRLPPRIVQQRPPVRRATAVRGSTQQIFPYLQHRSP